MNDSQLAEVGPGDNSSRTTIMETLSTVAFVDFASICPSGGESDHEDALELMALLIRTACQATNPAHGAVWEVDCRVYGGFRDIRGQPTERKAWLVRHLRLAGGLRDGVRIVPRLAESIICAPGATLVGTYANGQQKMVDAMIAEDMGAFARTSPSSLLLISDDDDFVPTVLGLSRTTAAPILWLRQRAAGRNDLHFTSTVTFLSDWRWQ